MSKLGGGKAARQARKRERQLKRDEKKRTSKWQDRSSARGVEKPRCNSRRCKNPGTKTAAQRQREREARQDERRNKREDRKDERVDARKKRVTKRVERKKEIKSNIDKKKTKPDINTSIEFDLLNDGGKKGVWRYRGKKKKKKENEPSLTPPSPSSEKSKNPRFL